MIKRKFEFIILSLLLGLYSCHSKHEKLLSFEYKYSHDFSEKESANYQLYLGNGKTTQKQVGDTLLLLVDLPWNGCADMEGNIEIKNDSLYLLYGLDDKTLCTELVHYELKYKVSNPEKIKYKTAIQFTKE